MTSTSFGPTSIWTGVRDTVADLYRVLSSIGVILLLSGCKPQEHRYESVCQVIRKDVVEVDDKGQPEMLDVELEWDPCPGDQFQVVRGGTEFARCMQNVPVGSLQPVLVKHWWDTRGYFMWDVYRIGGCGREIEPDSAGSYEKSQECSDTTAFGKTIGFKCSRRPFQKLVSVCPWMARY